MSSPIYILRSQTAIITTSLVKITATTHEHLKAPGRNKRFLKTIFERVADLVPGFRSSPIYILRSQTAIITTSLVKITATTHEHLKAPGRNKRFLKTIFERVADLVPGFSGFRSSPIYILRSQTAIITTSLVKITATTHEHLKAPGRNKRFLKTIFERVADLADLVPGFSGFRSSPIYILRSQTAIITTSLVKITATTHEHLKAPGRNKRFLKTIFERDLADLVPPPP